MNEHARLWRHSLQAYLDSTGAARPTPGSGPAAAITLATGTALLVKGLRISQQHAPAAERAELLRQAEQLIERLGELADADMQAFAEYLRARRDGAPDDTQQRQASRDACAVPLATARLGLEALKLALQAQPHARAAVQSDLQAGGLLVHAGIGAALINLEADLPALADGAERLRTAHAGERLRSDAASLLARLQARR